MFVCICSKSVEILIIIINLFSVKINIHIYQTSSNYDGRLPEEPNGSMNWLPIMNQNITTYNTIHKPTKQKQKEETLGPKQTYNTF